MGEGLSPLPKVKLPSKKAHHFFSCLAAHRSRILISCSMKVTVGHGCATHNVFVSNMTDKKRMLSQVHHMGGGGGGSRRAG